MADATRTDPTGGFTREHHESAILAGGSVLLPDGRLVDKIDDLPPVSDFAAQVNARTQAASGSTPVQDFAPNDSGGSSKGSKGAKTADAPADAPAA